MDTSKLYIKMCQQAHEIQELKGQVYKIGDSFNIPSLNDQVYTIPNIPISFSKYEEDYHISIRANTWILRLYQLQKIINEMYLDFTNPFFKFFQKLEDFVRTKECSQFVDNNSWEQIWLAFIMKEKYNKIWNTETENWETI